MNERKDFEYFYNLLTLIQKIQEFQELNFQVFLLNFYSYSFSFLYSSFIFSINSIQTITLYIYLHFLSSCSIPKIFSPAGFLSFSDGSLGPFIINLALPLHLFFFLLYSSFLYYLLFLSFL